MLYAKELDENSRRMDCPFFPQNGIKLGTPSQALKKNPENPPKHSSLNPTPIPPHPNLLNYFFKPAIISQFQF